MRVKAASLGISAEEYLAEQAVDSELDRHRRASTVGRRRQRPVRERGRRPAATSQGLPCQHRPDHPLRARVPRSASSRATARTASCAGIVRCSGCTAARPSSASRSTCSWTPRSALCRSADGPVPASRRWPCARDSRPVLERQQQRKSHRVPAAVRSRRAGARLPARRRAGEDERRGARPSSTRLGSVVSRNVLEEVIERGMLEVLPLTHIRGRSLHDAFVIVDEAQSLERNVLLTVLSRIGQNSRVVLTARCGPA